MMRIAIRMDDIAPGMDWAKFGRFRALCDRYGVRPLIGVVPDNRDAGLEIDPPREDFFETVKELAHSGWSVAMHGCHHVYTTKSGGLFPLNRLSEFAGLPYERQEELIRRGREILEDRGIVTRLFMAPAHNYDRNTLKALKQNGFDRITDGFGTAPYLYEGITFYPISFRAKETLSSGKDGVSTLVVHTNTMTEEDFRRYGEEVFPRHRIISYSELLAEPAVKRPEILRAKEYAMAEIKRRLVQGRG